MFSYKGSYYEAFTQEIIKLELEFPTVDRHGYPMYELDEHGQYRIDPQTNELMTCKIWRAPKYDQHGGYSQMMGNLVQNTLSELTMLSNEQGRSVLKRVEVISENFSNSSKIFYEHWSLFRKGNFDSWEFERKFFPAFGLTPAQSNIESYDRGNVTDDFWYDVSDFFMIQQGHLLWLIYFLRQIHAPDTFNTGQVKEKMPPNPGAAIGRGQYTRAQISKESVILYFKSRIEDECYKLKGTTKKINKSEILKKCKMDTLKNKKVPDSTFRSYLTKAKQEKLFDEIQRHISTIY